MRRRDCVAGGRGGAYAVLGCGRMRPPHAPRYTYEYVMRSPHAPDAGSCAGRMLEHPEETVASAKGVT